MIIIDEEYITGRTPEQVKTMTVGDLVEILSGYYPDDEIYLRFKNGHYGGIHSDFINEWGYNELNVNENKE